MVKSHEHTRFLTSCILIAIRYRTFSNFPYDFFFDPWIDYLEVGCLISKKKDLFFRYLIIMGF